MVWLNATPFRKSFSAPKVFILDQWNFKLATRVGQIVEYHVARCNSGMSASGFLTDEGDVVIFPSQLEHMVQRQPGIVKNPNGELYMSFSFNIELVTETEAQQRLGGNPQMDQKPGDYPTTSIPTEGGPPTPEGDQSGEWSSDWF